MISRIDNPCFISPCGHYELEIKQNFIHQNPSKLAFFRFWTFVARFHFLAGLERWSRKRRVKKDILCFSRDDQSLVKRGVGQLVENNLLKLNFNFDAFFHNIWIRNNNKKLTKRITLQKIHLPLHGSAWKIVPSCNYPPIIQILYF